MSAMSSSSWEKPLCRHLFFKLWKQGLSHNRLLPAKSNQEVNMLTVMFLLHLAIVSLTDLAADITQGWIRLISYLQTQRQGTDFILSQQPFKMPMFTTRQQRTDTQLVTPDYSWHNSQNSYHIKQLRRPVLWAVMHSNRDQIQCCGNNWPSFLAKRCLRWQNVRGENVLLTEHSYTRE